MMHLHIVCPLGMDQRLEPHTARSVDAVTKHFGTTCEEWHGLYPEENRNKGITRSKKKHQTITKAPFFLFVDHDMEFTPDHIERMIDRDAPVVSAAYPYRGDQDRFVAGCWIVRGISGTKLLSSTKGLAVVDWCGAGLLLVKAETFAMIEYPYFRHTLVEHEDEAEDSKEDMGFCMQLNAAGIPIYVDCTCVAGHYVTPKREGQDED